MDIERLHVIGTSHIAKESVDEIVTLMDSFDPDIVAVELDAQRLKALTEKKDRKPSLRDIRHIGLTGWLFTLIGGWAQQKLGKAVGIMPGEDMLSAVREAKGRDLQVALIDQNVAITLRKLSRTITWREKLRFIMDILRAVIFRKREMRRLGITSLDLSKVPPKKLVRTLTKELKRRYPNVYRVLVEERNEVMSMNIVSLLYHFPDKKILAVVGAGHEEGMGRMIEKRYKKVFI